MSPADRPAGFRWAWREPRGAEGAAPDPACPHERLRARGLCTRGRRGPGRAGQPGALTGRLAPLPSAASRSAFTCGNVQTPGLHSTTLTLIAAQGHSTGALGARCLQRCDSLARRSGGGWACARLTGLRARLDGGFPGDTQQALPPGVTSPPCAARPPSWPGTSGSAFSPTRGSRAGGNKPLPWALCGRSRCSVLHAPFCPLRNVGVFWSRRQHLLFMWKFPRALSPVAHSTMALQSNSLFNRHAAGRCALQEKEHPLPLLVNGSSAPVLPQALT